MGRYEQREPVSNENYLPNGRDPVGIGHRLIRVLDFAVRKNPSQKDLTTRGPRFPGREM